MTMFLIAFAVFLIVVGAMAIGVFLSGKRIQGSCGGFANAMINERGEKVCGYCGVTYEKQQAQGCADPETRSSS